MDLKLATTLVGDAYPGQEVELIVKGQPYRFAYMPHGMHDNVWRLTEQDGETVRQNFPRLGEDWMTEFDPSFFQVYLDTAHPIAVDCPLYLKAVPRGNALSGDRAKACLGKVESIIIP